MCFLLGEPPHQALRDGWLASFAPFACLFLDAKVNEYSVRCSVFSVQCSVFSVQCSEVDTDMSSSL